MPQLLENYFIPGHTSVVVAGTHGKTTTTAMLAWIFQVAGRRPNFLIGGVAPNFGDRSYGLGGGEEFIIEGDEYDTAFFDKAPKFLHYHPDELIITSLEYDHADIYPDLASIELQFRRLVNLVPRRGRIIAWGESPQVRAATAKAFCPVETFGLAPDCDWYAGDILWHDQATEFRVAYRGSEVTRIRMPVAGRHNVLDALAAIALAYGRGVECEAIEQCLRHFPERAPPYGDQGRGRRRAGRRGFRAPSHGDSPHAGSRAHPLAGPQDLGGHRAAIEHHAPQNFSGRAAGSLGYRRPRADRPGESRAVSLRRRAPFARSHRRESQPAWASRAGLRSAAEIADYLAANANPGDLVLVMSNGSFDGLCAKLLEKLKSLAGSPRMILSGSRFRFAFVCALLGIALLSSPSCARHHSIPHFAGPQRRTSISGRNGYSGSAATQLLSPCPPGTHSIKCAISPIAFAI